MQGRGRGRGRGQGRGYGRGYGGRSGSGRGGGGRWGVRGGHNIDPLIGALHAAANCDAVLAVASSAAVNGSQNGSSSGSGQTMSAAAACQTLHSLAKRLPPRVSPSRLPWYTGSAFNVVLTTCANTLSTAGVRDICKVWWAIARLQLSPCESARVHILAVALANRTNQLLQDLDARGLCSALWSAAKTGMDLDGNKQAQKHRNENRSRGGGGGGGAAGERGGESKSDSDSGGIGVGDGDTILSDGKNVHAMQAALGRLVELAPECNGQDVGNALWALAKLCGGGGGRGGVATFDYGDGATTDSYTASVVAAADSLRKRALVCAHDFKPQETANCVWGLAHLRAVGGADGRDLVDIVRGGRSPLSAYSPQNLSNVAWALGRVVTITDSSPLSTTPTAVSAPPSSRLSSSSSSTTTTTPHLSSTERSKSSNKKVATTAVSQTPAQVLLKDVADEANRRLSSSVSSSSSSSSGGRGVVGGSFATATSSATSILSGQDVSTVCGALARHGLRHETLLSSVASDVTRHGDKYAARDIAAVAWSLAALKFAPDGALASLAAVARLRLSEFSPQDLSTLLHAFATLETVPAGGLMRAAASAGRARADEFTWQDASMMAWAYATLEQPPPRMLLRSIENALEQKDKLGKVGGSADGSCGATGRAVGTLLWAHARMRLRPTAGFMRLVSGFCAREAGRGGLSSQELCNAIWALAVLDLPRDQLEITGHDAHLVKTPALAPVSSAHQQSAEIGAAACGRRGGYGDGGGNGSDDSAFKKADLVDVLGRAALARVAILNAHDVANLVFGLARLERRPGGTGGDRALARALRTSAKSLSPQQVAYAFWAAGKLGFNGRTLFERLCSRAKVGLDKMHAQNIGMVAWGLACLAPSAPPPQPPQLLAETAAAAAAAAVAVPTRTEMSAGKQALPTGRDDANGENQPEGQVASESRKKKREGKKGKSEKKSNKSHGGNGSDGESQGNSHGSSSSMVIAEAEGAAALSRSADSSNDAFSLARDLARAIQKRLSTLSSDMNWQTVAHVEYMLRRLGTKEDIKWASLSSSSIESSTTSVRSSGSSVINRCKFWSRLTQRARVTADEVDAKHREHDSAAKAALLSRVPELISTLASGSRILLVGSQGDNEIAAALGAAGHAVDVWNRFTSNGCGSGTKWPAKHGSSTVSSPSSRSSFGACVLRLPYIRDAFCMTLQAVAHRLEEGAPLLVYGHSDEGIRSSGVATALAPLFRVIIRQPLSVRATGGSRGDRDGGGVDDDGGRRGSRSSSGSRSTSLAAASTTAVVGSDGRVIEARRTRSVPERADELKAWRTRTRMILPGSSDAPPLPWRTYPGLFAGGTLDVMTAALLRLAPAPPPGARCVDFGCGSGCIAAALAVAHAPAHITLIDADSVALEAARHNVPSGVATTAVLSDCWSSVPAPTDTEPASFDWIVSNPPVHFGRCNWFGVVRALIAGAVSRLAPQGRLVLVAQNYIPVGRLLAAGGMTDIHLASDGRFSVWWARPDTGCSDAGGSIPSSCSRSDEVSISSIGASSLLQTVNPAAISTATAMLSMKDKKKKKKEKKKKKKKKKSKDEKNLNVPPAAEAVVTDHVSAAPVSVLLDSVTMASKGATSCRSPEGAAGTRAQKRPAGAPVLLLTQQVTSTASTTAKQPANKRVKPMVKVKRALLKKKAAGTTISSPMLISRATWRRYGQHCQTMSEREWHPLMLKVMRLTKPTPALGLPISCEVNDLPGETLSALASGAGAGVTGPSFSALGESAMLPAGFGNIYLGERLSCYVHVHNEHDTAVRDVFVKVELRTETQRVTLTRAEVRPTPSVEPGDGVNLIVHHDVKEIGTHHLICSVLYTAGASGEQAIFHKTYKFAVGKPIDVKTRDYMVDGAVLLEVQLQNQTESPIHIQSVSLQATEGFTAQDFNEVEVSSLATTGNGAGKHGSSSSSSSSGGGSSGGSSSSGSISTFGSTTYINPQDTRQYLYRLLATDGRDARTLGAMGKLDIVWHTQMGSVGHLQTSALPRKPTSGDVGVCLRAEEMPATVVAGTPFELRCAASNPTRQPVTLVLHADSSSDAKPAVMLEHNSGVELGTVPPNSSLELTVRLLAVRSGLQPVRSFYAIDKTTGRKYYLSNLDAIFVSKAPE